MSVTTEPVSAILNTTDSAAPVKGAPSAAGIDDASDGDNDDSDANDDSVDNDDDDDDDDSLVETASEVDARPRSLDRFSAFVIHAGHSKVKVYGSPSISVSN